MIQFTDVRDACRDIGYYPGEMRVSGTRYNMLAVTRKYNLETNKVVNPFMGANDVVIEGVWVWDSDKKVSVICIFVTARWNKGRVV